MKIILSCWAVLLVTQEPRKVQKSMSQNDDQKIAVSIGIYSIEGLDVGFWGGGVANNIYIYIYIYVFIYLFINL